MTGRVRRAGETRGATRIVGHTLGWRLSKVAAALGLILLVPGASSAQDGGNSRRRGLFRLGPLYVTPTLRVGQIGYDSNVFYSATERTGDFVARGGPGLELLLPVGSTVDIGARGGVDILYFAKVESERRATWNGLGFLRFSGSRTRAELTGGYEETFRRPDFEIDDRVFEATRRADVSVERRLGRNRLRAGFSAQRLGVERDQVSDADDLARNLNRTTYRGRLGFGIGLTPKTSLIVEADHQVDDFLLNPSRDTSSNRLYGGFEIASLTRLSGSALAGARVLRQQATASERWFPYIDVDLRYRFGPRTAIALFVRRDQRFSAFSATTGTQTSKQSTNELALGRQLWGPVEIRLFGGLRQLQTDGAIAQTDATAAVREDDEWYGGANLGVRFRDWFRVGVEARYSDRNSNFSDFGVEGLIVGVTVSAVPGDIIDLITP